MITNTGRAQHLNIVAGKANRFADKFVVGSSNAPLTADAKELDFGWGECLVKDTYVDTANGQVIFYGTLPAEYAGQISEIGLATMNSEFIQTGRDINISYYFSPLEGWVYSAPDKFSYDSESSLMGADDVEITNAIAGETLRKSVSDDMSLHSNIKMRISAAQSGSIIFRIYSSETGYVSKTISLTEGENVIKFSVDSMTESGEFNPAVPVGMEFEMVTPGAYLFDAIVFTGESNSGLVTRSAVSVPKKKVVGNTMELEYAVMLGV